MADRAYTDADLDAAIAAVSDPARLREAEDLVVRAAPSLQRVLNVALHEGGWFDDAHRQAVQEVAGTEDAQARTRAIQTLIAEETRVGMMVGVAVGFELARELGPGRMGSASRSGGSRAAPSPGSASRSGGSRAAPSPGSPASRSGGSRAAPSPTTEEED